MEQNYTKFTKSSSLFIMPEKDCRSMRSDTQKFSICYYIVEYI